MSAELCGVNQVACGPRSKVHKDFTAFCQQPDGHGTIAIFGLKAKSLKSAKRTAKLQCAELWKCKPADIHVLGIAEGDVKILHWEDLES